MRHHASSAAIGALLTAVVAGCGGGAEDPVADFAKRVTEYVRLERRLEAELPPVTTTRDRAETDTRRQALAVKLQAALHDRRVGELFTPPIAAVFRERLRSVTAGEAGRNVRGAILDDNPSTTRVSARAPYPEAASLSTVPSAVLAVLPPLPEALEYRFVGRQLIVRDVAANLVVDVLPDAVE